jgi:DNA polymerase I-like protein with 3'-5' exonuclease and polymerase domains
MLQKEGYHKTYEEWNAIRKDSTHELYSLIKDRRQRAKAINFGCPGGLGVAALVEYAKGYGVELTFNQADDLRKTWFEMWPEMKDYFNMISEASNMSVDGTFHITQLYSGRVRGGCTYTSGANSYFQGLAADGAKAAMWALYKACYLGELPEYLEGQPCHLLGVRMWAFIHDEFLFEGDEDTAHLWAPQASAIMVGEMRKYTPDVAQAAPPALMRRWLKKAEPVYNDSGDLVPWEE